MDVKALKLCASFSRQPNHLGYCGRPSAIKALQACLIENNCQHVPEEIAQFIVLNPYLTTIAAITGLPKLSYPVVEAFWFGNDLLNLCLPKHYTLLLDNLKQQGVPDVLIAEAIANPPKTFIPIHLFNIIHIGVGRASGSVPFTLHSINQCMIRWGTVKTLLPDNHAHISLHTLTPKFALEEKLESVPFNPMYFPKLSVGTSVAVHWGEIARVLTKGQTDQLVFWTNRFLASL